jgi:hypothetical protein
MKAMIMTLIAMTTAGGLAVATDIFPAIATTDGKTYDHITAQRTDPDGLYIEYTLPGNGMGSAKLKFSRLSADLQKQYGYDADAAKKYEDDAYRATLDFQAWAEKQDAASQKARADAAAREFQLDAIMAQSSQQSPGPAGQAAADLAPYGGGYPYLGGWAYGAYGRRASLNSWTGSTFKGLLPADRLFTPLGYSPTKTQAVPATPRIGRNPGPASQHQQ